MRTDSVAEERRNRWTQAIDGAPVKDKTTFGEPLDNVGLAQAIADMPADRHGERKHYWYEQ